jgi:hypothetical protein
MRNGHDGPVAAGIAVVVADDLLDAVEARIGMGVSSASPHLDGLEEER